MKTFLLAFALFSSVGCFGLHSFFGNEGSDRPDGPSLPNGGTDWAGSPEVPNAWLITVKNAQGSPEQGDKSTQGPTTDHKRVLDRENKNGPVGMDTGYYVSLTNDHYAGPDHGVD